MGAQNGGRAVVALAAVTALLVAVVVVTAAVGTKRRVILYGDSLAFESRDYFALELQSGADVEVVDRTFGGTAICDRLDRMRRDLRALQPTAVVLEFVGNNVTDCMRGPSGPLTGDALVQKYRDDARIATEIFAGAGVRFTATLPCLPSEGPGEGCVGGHIPVRALDGVHFCPVRTREGGDRCPVYSGGAARFGLAMAEPVRRDLGL